MLRVEGRLTLRGIHIELQTPIDPINDRWSVFELFGDGQVRLENCTITVIARDSFASRELSIFRLGGRERLFSDGTVSLEEQDRPKIEMVNCAIRGETNLVRDYGMRGWELDWQNGFFVSSGRMFNLRPTDKEDTSNDDTIHVQLQNVTSFMDSGLLSVSLNAEQQKQRLISITAKDSIFSTKAWSTFVSFKGTAENIPQSNKLSFSGIGNAYEGVKTFFAILNEDDMPTETKTWNEWRRAYSQGKSISGNISWAFKPDDEEVSMAKRNVSDYQLDTAHGEQSAGFVLEDLPEFPQPLRLDEVLNLGL